MWANDSQGRQTTVEHGDASNPGAITKITDPAGRKYLYHYMWVNSQKLLTSYTDPEGGVTQYAYNADNQLSQVTTRGGRVTKIHYYSSGEKAGMVLTITRVTNALTGTGPVTEFDYHDVARDGSSKAIVTDPRSNDTNYIFDTGGRPTNVTDGFSAPLIPRTPATTTSRKYTAPFNTGCRM